MQSRGSASERKKKKGKLVSVERGGGKGGRGIRRESGKGKLTLNIGLQPV